MIIVLDDCEKSLISGGSCYGSSCRSCDEFYLGNARSESECRQMCRSRNWCEYFSFHNPTNCNKSCLGSCWSKCDFHPQGIVEALSGAGTNWREMCKDDCYKKCNC